MADPQPAAESGHPPYRRLTTLAIVAIVLLRLATGWHFWREGTKKLVYDSDGNLHVEAPTEDLFRRAVGPFAAFYKSKLPDFHDWESLLAVPREQTVDSAAELDAWVADYQQRRDRASREGAFVEPEFPEVAPYHAWTEKIRADLRAINDRVVKLSGMSAEQQAAAAERFAFRERQLAEYLAGEAGAIAQWQHELWRLENWQSSDEAGEVPFTDERIAEKRAETTAEGRSWVDQVQGIERGYVDDLAALAAAPKGKSDDKLAAAIAAATTEDRERDLARLNVAVTCLIVGVGFCLLTGLFTRLAALGGMVFLLSVMATQPPWVPAANLTFFYYQLVEFAALGVLLATAAGRFGGLDFFLYALWRKLRGAPARA